MFNEFIDMVARRKTATVKKSSKRVSSPKVDSTSNLMMLSAALLVSILSFFFIRDQLMSREKQQIVVEKTKTVSLSAQGGSKQVGVATIKEVGGFAVVSVVIAPGVKGIAQPAHIHVGSCPTPGEVKYPLSSVVDGKSETTLTISYDELMKQMPLAINVHKSTAQSKMYVSRGNL